MLSAKLVADVEASKEIELSYEEIRSYETLKWLKSLKLFGKTDYSKTNAKEQSESTVG